MREMEILKGLEGGENMAVQFVDHLLALGLRKKASDIHLEPGEEQMTVRMRTDGRLKVCAAVEMRHHPMILTRVKVMADMDIAEKRLPQDGHIRVSIQGKPADLRVSVIPTIHGEKAVLRFLNTDTVIDSPETFGMSEENYGKVLDILKRPNGIFYITGPTGSGKTTTLYMILERLAVDKTIRAMIAGGCREEEIASYAENILGMRTLRDDLLRLVDQGITTAEELERLTFGEQRP